MAAGCCSPAMSRRALELQVGTTRREWPKPPSLRTKPTICSIPRRKNSAARQLPARAPRGQPSPKHRQENPIPQAPNPRAPLPWNPPAKPAAKASAEVPAARAAPIISIESDVDPESWAEYGGWYRQDFTIFYRPTGHKDKFIYSWLVLTGTQSPKGEKEPRGSGLRDPHHQGRAGVMHEMPQRRRYPGPRPTGQFLAGLGQDQARTLYEFRP